MSDLIDRQAVIKAITNAADKWDCSDDYMRGIKAGIRMGTLISSVIPSVQPEIIHCRDCKHKYGSCCDNFAEVWVSDNDYCSRAERKEDNNETD